MNISESLLLLVAVLASSLGQLFLKLGAARLGAVTGANAIAKILGILSIPELLLGLACYGCGAIGYILVLTRVNLSVAGPASSLVYVFSVLLGLLVFKETLPLTRTLGLGLIVAGVLLVVAQKS